jgi:hypothetical protein
VAIALVLLVLVASLTWFGHGGRTLFGLMTVAFLIVSTIVIVHGFVSPTGDVQASQPESGHAATPIAVLLAFPVAMALATGVEAPSSAVAQLGQLGRAEKVRFGQITLWMTIAIVGALTLSLTALAVRLDVGVPDADSTMIAGIAKAATGDGLLFAAFQTTSAVLLLAAASSSFQAGPGLLKALSGDASTAGILPASLGRSNHHHTPYWSAVVFLAAAGSVVVAAGGRDQELVLFYAVTVFVSFLFGLLAMSRFTRQEVGSRVYLLVNIIAIIAVATTLVINLARGFPLVSIAAACLIAGGLHRRWVRAGRPAGASLAEERSVI